MLALSGATAASAAPWGFEQVSPVDKGAGAVSAIDTFTVTRDGGTMLYSAIGSFDEYPSVAIPAYNRYLAHRGATRWENRSVELPYDPPPGGFGIALDVMQTLRASVNLKYALTMSARALLPGAIQGGSNLYMEELATGKLKLVAATPGNNWLYNSITHLGQISYSWVSPDGDAALFYLEQEEVDGVQPGEVLWTEEGGLEPAAFDESGNPTASVFPPGFYDNGPHEPLPADGALDHLYMSANLTTPAYLMEDEKAVPISVSERAEDLGAVKNAEVISVSAKGRYVFLRATGRLTEDTPELGGEVALYRYDHNDGSLTYIGYGGPGSLSVMQATEDGQTIAFITNKSLRPGDPTPPVNGANLYVWRNGSLQLVYTTDAGSKISAGSSMWPTTLHVLSRNGRYLYFTDDSPTLAEEFGTAPTSLACASQAEPSVARPCDQVYLYDADAPSDKLDCVSCVDGVSPGQSGDILSANNGYVRFNSHPNQYVSDDGRAFFATYESYDPADQNSLPDVYEFHEGNYRLVSTGANGQSARFIDASDDGKTIYFTTADPIVPQDTDKAVDLYVTREGAGFPYDPNEVTPPCLGLESCHGPIPGVASGPGASTSTFVGKTNPAIVNGKVKVTKSSARGTVAKVTVRVSGPGKLTASGSGLVKANKRARKAGSVTLTVRLTASSKSALKRKGVLKRTVRVAFEPEDGRGASANRTVAFKASAGKGGR